MVRLLILFLAVSLPGVLIPRGVSAQEQLSDSVLSTDDGPHVFWADDSTAIVFYYCHDSVISRTFIVHDTLQFPTFCGPDLGGYTLPVYPAGPGPDALSGIAKFFALSDLHGDYDHLTEILRNAGIVDSALRWQWGTGHLVIDGDLFDRGPAVTECLWLIYRLEQEAAREGGAVHFLLGNHELMVMRGDLRYVHERYTKGIARRNRFTYDDLYGPDMALGRWLRTKQTVLTINRTLFVHGGVTVELAARGLDIRDINDLVRSGLDYSSPRLYCDSLVRAAYGTFGPLWYRGYTTELEDRYPMITSSGIDSILSYFDVDQVVVGHTEQDSLTTLFDGRVIAIDVDVESLGGHQGLLWDDGTFYRVDRTGARTVLK